MNLYNYKAKIKRVVDGDTVDVYIDLGFDVHYFSRVRLSGINTPESRTRNLEEKKLGLAAKEYVDQWFQNYGSEFIIQTTKDQKEKYGRVLGTVTSLDGTAWEEFKK